MSNNFNRELKILIIDDIKSARKVLIGLLNQLGIENILESSLAEDALKILAEEQIDLVISDLNLIESDGEKLLEKMRALPNHHKTPYIIMTSDRTPQRLSYKTLDDISGFIFKPFNANDLQEKIHSALNI